MSKSNDAPMWWPCNTGMHQEFGQNAAPPGTIYQCLNVRLENDGCLLKRPGLSGIAATVPSGTPAIVGDGSTYAIEKPRFLTMAGESAIVGLTNGDVFARNPTSGEFIFSGRCSSALPVRRRKGDMGITPQFYQGKQPGIAVNSQGYVMFVAVSGTTAQGIMHIYIEAPDGTRILNYRHTGSPVRRALALAVGSTFYVVWHDATGSGTDIRAEAVSLTTGLSSSTVVATLTSTSAFWDASAYDGTHWYLVHQSGPSTMRVDRFAGTTSNANVTFAVTGTAPCSLFANSDLGEVWVGYYDDPAVTGDVNYRVYDNTLASSVLGETTLVTGANIYGPPLFGRYYDAASPTQTTACLYVYRVVNTTGDELRAMGVGVAYNDGTTATTPVLTYQCNPISKPDNFNRVWVQICPPGGEDSRLGQSRTMLLRFVQKTAGTAVFPTIELASPPNVWLADKGPEAEQGRFHAIARTSTRSYWAFPMAIANLADDDTVDPVIAIAVYEYTASDQEPHADAEQLDTTALIAGGLAETVSQFKLATDALHEGVTEVGFAHRPTIISATADSGGTSVAAGTYSYRAVYEWVDQDGRRHRSEPSLPVSLTLNEASDVVLKVSAIHITQRRNANAVNTATLAVYRTVNGGTTYHRLPGQSEGTGGGTGVISTGDDTSDADLADNEILYTDGGVLPNRLGPTCRFVAKGEDRVWCGGLWDPTLIECSKVLVPGEPVQFTNDPTHQVVLAAPCTGLAYQDGSVIAFTEDEIYLISGEGPNDQGIGSFPAPRKMAHGIGCIDYRSVLETNIGTFFQSRRGIELLPRGFGPVEYVGKMVKDRVQISGLVECLGAAVHLGPKYHLARFLMALDGQTEATSTLVFDLERGEWSEDTHQASGAIGVWPDGVAYASASFDSATYTHPFLYDNNAQTGDGGSNSYINSSVTFARAFPFPGGHCGWGRFNKIMVAVEAVASSTQTLSLTVQTDNNTNQTPTFTITRPPVLNWRELAIKDQNASSLQVTISDSNATATAGLKYFGVGVAVDPVGGLRLVASGDRA